MAYITLDTETTGLKPEDGHRVIEIGCIKIEDRKITEERFHIYLNPERLVDEGAFRVHGIGNDFLKDKPLFVDIYQDFLKFIAGHTLVIHNAKFDLGFLNHELKRVGYDKTIEEHCDIIDTYLLSKKNNPGGKHSLDGICRYYYIDNSKRTLHGALLDAEILASVYLAMTGGQKRLFNENSNSVSSSEKKFEKIPKLESHTPIIFADEDEVQAHNSYYNNK